MRILLDTVTFLWAVTGAPEISNEARELFEDPDNEIYLSSVSTCEIAVKHSLGKLPLPEAPAKFVPTQRKQHDIDPIELDEEATLYRTRLPLSIQNFDLEQKKQESCLPHRPTAPYVNKILKVTEPAELSVQQAKKFEFIISLKAAKQFGVKFRSCVRRSNKVIN